MTTITNSKQAFKYLDKSMEDNSCVPLQFIEEMVQDWMDKANLFANGLGDRPEAFRCGVSSEEEDHIIGLLRVM